MNLSLFPLGPPPPPYTNSEKHNSENWSLFLRPSLPIEIVNKTLNYIIKFVTFKSTEWKLNPNKASNVYIRRDWVVFHDNLLFFQVSFSPIPLPLFTISLLFKIVIQVRYPPSFSAEFTKSSVFFWQASLSLYVLHKNMLRWF